MGKKYWEAKGELRTKILEHMDRQSACMKAAFAFAEKHGTKNIGASLSMFPEFVLIFDTPPDPKIWKPVKGTSNQYRPKLSSKEGKKLGEQMEAIFKGAPTGTELAKLIGLNVFADGGAWRTPGCQVVGKRVLVVAHESYSPPAKLAAQLVRVSDLEWEKLSKSDAA